jgi:hypothetical protein
LYVEAAFVSSTSAVEWVSSAPLAAPVPPLVVVGVVVAGVVVAGVVVAFGVVVCSGIFGALLDTGGSAVLAPGGVVVGVPVAGGATAAAGGGAAATVLVTTLALRGPFSSAA